MTSTESTALARLWAALLAVLSFVPFVNWIGGGHEAPGYSGTVSEWMSGSAISIGSALVLFLVLRRLDWRLWPAWWSSLAGPANRQPALTGAVVGSFALALYATIATRVLSGRPLLIDEIIQVMQARIFAEGKLYRTANAFPEFFSALHVVDVNGKVFSQFPPGGPLALLPAVWAGAGWLSGPIFGAIAVVAWWRLVRRTDTAGVALGAALLLAGAPFMAFMAGSHMNHVPTLAWLCLAMLALHHVTTSTGPRPLPAFWCGLSLGMMLAIRPVDGAAFAAPAGIWLLWRAIGDRSLVTTLLASGAGIALPIVGVFGYNVATTGDAALFGYELLWGASHNLGFHRAPWGVTHTPARGLELINLYFLRLQTYLFESPLPSLVPAMGALALVRRLTPFDRYLLVASGLLVGGYFAYWHDGFFLGPRFFYLLVPLLVLWTARLPSIVRDRFPALHVDRAVLLCYAVSAVVAIGISLPVRVRQYSGGMLLARHDYTAPAERAGVRNALILVRESWGAQLIARLYALGVSRTDAEGLYRTVDTCILDGAISELERGGLRGPAALDRMRPLTADSLRLVISTLSPDGTERVLPGATYSDVCQRRILEDRAGYSFLAPLLARDPGTNIYARDLHARDTLLLQRYPDRRVYLLRAVSSEIGAPLTLEPVNLDSARAEWSGVSR